ncbi:MAG: polyprenol monophosphomannose synthase [Kiritimatiellae bacterium]|nr:polyprenol monophosphomannose synthase [Kiritimatiellia bacterium]
MATNPDSDVQGKALVILPTYNEADNIRRIVPAIVDACPAADVLVVDDNSPDGTGAIAEEVAAKLAAVHVVHRAEKAGLGRAYIDGFRWGLARDYAYLFEMDADFSHDPAMLPWFLNAAREADLVIGSRYIPGGAVINWPMNRLLLSYFASLYARLFTGLTVHDCTGGFKCFRREVLLSIPLDLIRSNGYAFQIEMNFEAQRRGFRLKEIPIIFTDRIEGSSKMSRKIVYEAFFVVLSLFARRLRRPREPEHGAAGAPVNR